MIPRTIAQAVVGDGGLIAWSDDFDDAWRTEIERIVEAFGLPRGIAAPDGLFTVPLLRRHVAIVNVAGRRYRFLILSRKLYDVIPDPFAIADRFPPKWDGPLPTLEWPLEPLPQRTVAQLDAIFKHGDGPFLLGACQALVDSGRIALAREQPQSSLFRDIWNLIPDSIRRQTSLATFAYSNALDFSLLAMPTIPDGGIIGYLSDEQTRDYPESKYERELQTAVEAGDQNSVDRLLARRSSAETLRLAVWLVLAATAVSIAMRLLTR
ncbi:MAG TPA: hypothetical protein VHR66_25835 [Gemmataceae bacterium]|jgi:hypothetical protein|nr:hypothetical protein [Gemmataceae bacterium]